MGEDVTNHDFVLGQLSSQMEHVLTQLAELTKEVKHLSDRLHGMESVELPDKVRQLEVVVKLLQQEQIERAGVAKAAAWVPKALGWIVAMATAVVSWALIQYKE